MKASGVESDSKDLDTFFARIDGKTVPELVAAGKEKHISMPCGGGGGGGAVAAVADDKPKEEEKREEAEDVDMGGLFGDDDDY